MASFAHPSARELQHDFLWRTTRDLPERGRIGIFNRTYYEEVLIVRVYSSMHAMTDGTNQRLDRTRSQNLSGSAFKEPHFYQ